MGTFHLVPADNPPALTPDLELRMRAECRSVQSTHLAGRNCQWQLRSQEDATRPYFARAVDPESGALLYTLCFSPGGGLAPNRLAHEAVFPISRNDPFAVVQRAYTDVVSGKAEALGLSVRGIEAYRCGLWAVHEDNPLQIRLTVEHMPTNSVQVENELSETCKHEANLGAMHYRGGPSNVSDVRIKLSAASAPTLDSATRTNGSELRRPAPITTSNLVPSLQKKGSRSSLKGSAGTPPRSPVIRRVSSNLSGNTRGGMSPKQPSPRPPEPLSPPCTPSSIADEFFKRDLALHAELGPDATLAVILHDSCYGHRFSRPKTSKANLSTIVERPERMLAITLGVATAYVLRGGRHAGSRYPPHPKCKPGSVPFIVKKSNRFVPLTSPVVANVHGNKWMNELKVMCDGAETKLATNGKELVRPADGEVDKPQFHEGDLYLCAESLDAFEGALGGVLDAVDTVFDVVGPKSAFVGIRPPGHHCSADYPAGFCWLNNVHVGISHAAAVHGLTHAAIIDFDLHHGDGSQAITWAHNARVASLPKNAPYSKRTSIGYFSLHDINSYPCEWGDEEKVQSASLCIENAHGQTVWNTHLQPWKTDAEFWELYKTRYAILVEKARDYLKRETIRLRGSVNAPQPRSMIFISAGFDASEWEGQGMQRHKVNVPTDFYDRFTRDIMAMSKEPGLAVDGRVVSVLEGGYSDRALTSGVMSHLCGMMDREIQSPDYENLASQLENLSMNTSRDLTQLDARAWAPAALDDLEAAANGPDQSTPRKPRGPINPTYSTPTQSFNAKIHPAVAARRSITQANEPVHQPTVDEVAPILGWALSAQELAKVLVPDRQTRSCRPEDLNAEATRIRRSRLSTVGNVAEPPTPIDETKRMQLRTKKSKPAAEESVPRPRSRSKRRTTIEGSEIAGLVTADATPRPVAAPRRRVSVASTILSTTEEDPEISRPEPRRSRRSSSSVATRSISPSTKRAGSVARKTSRPNSPSKPRAPRKTAANKTPRKAPATPSLPVTEVQSIDSLTDGVKRMSIKLNLGPRPEVEPKKKTARAPRKPAASRERKKAGDKSKTVISPTGIAESEDVTVSSFGSEALTSPTELVRPFEGSVDPKLRSKIDQPESTSDPATHSGGIVESSEAAEIQEQPPNLASQKTVVEPPPDKTNESIHLESPQASKIPLPQPNAGGPPAMGPLQPSATLLNKSMTPEATRLRLPVFTSKSPIPFALSNTNAGKLPYGQPPVPNRFSAVQDKRPEHAHGDLINPSTTENVNSNPPEPRPFE